MKKDVFLSISVNMSTFKDGVTVRSMFALATPLVPLLLLMLCGCVSELPVWWPLAKENQRT